MAENVIKKINDWQQWEDDMIQQYITQWNQELQLEEHTKKKTFEFAKEDMRQTLD